MKICKVEGCPQPYRARDLCSTHYNQQHQPLRHPRLNLTCEWCGRGYATKRANGRFCSLACRDAKRAEAARLRLLPVHIGPAWPRTEIPDQHPCRRPKRRRPEWWTVLIAGDCGWCGGYFVGCAADVSHAPRYCSKRCQANANRRRFTVRTVDRLAIYERDGWVCQLCAEPVDAELGPSDPWGATLDHVVCQAWGKPDHSPENLRLAHRWCNSVRGDERYYTAAVLAA